VTTGAGEDPIPGVPVDAITEDSRPSDPAPRLCMLLLLLLAAMLRVNSARAR